MAERTLMQIIDAAKDGQRPSHDECWLAMLALDSLLHFEQRALWDLANERRPALIRDPKFQRDESFRRNKEAFAKPPRDWIGEHNLPGHPEQVRRRAFAKAAWREVERREAEQRAAGGDGA